MEALVESENDAGIDALRLKKILVPTDFSPPARNAYRYALRFGRQFGAAVTLLHVLEKVSPISGLADLPVQSDYLGERLDIAEKNLRALSAASERGKLPRIGTTVREGNAAVQINEAARQLHTDLIVVGTHGYTGLKHLLLGSTAEEVVRSAPCPVMVVREKEHEFI